MKPHDHDEEERSAIEEQLQDYSNLAFDEKIRQLMEEVEYQIECRAETPSQFKPWLRNFLETRITGKEHDSKKRDSYVYDVFLHDLRKVGFIRAVLHNINEDDADYKERRRGAWNHLPDFSIAWPVIHYVLEHEENHELRTYACKWITEYAPDKQTAVALLTKALRRKCPFAALQLSRLAPDTPGVVEVLADALGHEWIAHNYESYDNGVGGAGEAAFALRRMGIRARTALPRLRAAVMSEREFFSSSTDRLLAFEAYAAISADDAEVGGLLDELAASERSGGELLGSVARLAQERPFFLPHLARLKQRIREKKGEVP